jgi:hypothetical protein
VDWQKSAGPDLLPKDDPSWLREADPAFDALYRESAETAESEELRRTLIWAAAAQMAFESHRRWTEFPGFHSAAYGFADPETELDAFAVLVYVRPGTLRGALPPDPRPVRVGDEYFPVVVREAYVRDHAPAENPHGASAACWAQLNGGAPTSSGADIGFLTAPHALQPPYAPVASTVTTDQGWTGAPGAGEVLALGPPGIEAAVVAPGLTSPGPGAPLAATRFPAPWADVTLTGHVSSFATKITAVSDTRGTLNPLVPATVFTARAGRPGDSGGLLRTASEGVGIYRGDLTTVTGNVEGRAQHLAQAAEALDLTLYD